MRPRKMRPGFATRWAWSRRRACRTRFCPASRIRWAISSRGTPGRTCRFTSKTSRLASVWASRRFARPWSGWPPAAGCWKASSCRAAEAGNGAMPKCCGCSSGVRWRGCASRSSRSAPEALARFLTRWQGIDAAAARPGRPAGRDRATAGRCRCPPRPWNNDILPRRVEGYRPSDLDELCAAGEVVWRGCESLGPDDGRIALYLTDHYPQTDRPRRAGAGRIARPHPPAAGRARGVVLRRSGGRDRRLSQRRARGALAIGLGGRGDQRHAGAAAFAAARLAAQRPVRPATAAGRFAPAA